MTTPWTWSWIASAFVCAGVLTACSRTDETEAGSSSPTAKPQPVNVSQLEADVRFLASDALEGREAGTRGYDVAAQYVAERFRALKLEPAGDNGSYFQKVPMRAVKSTIAYGGKLEFAGSKAPARVVAGKDYAALNVSGAATQAFEADVVFVGFGLVSDRHKRDDYAGLDVKGKIVARFPSAPKFLHTEERAHYTAITMQSASERGAIGLILLATPTLERVIPFPEFVNLVSRQTPLIWLDASGKPFTQAPNIRGAAMLSPDAAADLFAKAPVKWPELEAAAESDMGEVKGFPLDVKARMTFASDLRDVVSSNVVGLFRGSDPKLANEYVVVTAHLDHEGIKGTPAKDDDEIYNGAMDNATGIASMLEVARRFELEPPRRSVLFLAVTAEETGLVGSEYFAHNPVVAKANIVANVNLDMPVLTYEFTDVVAFGAERSTIEPAVRSAVTEAGLILSPDPNPDQGFFTRSDQYSFVQQGVPSIFLVTGWDGAGKAAQGEFLTKHYHKPSDEPGHVLYPALARFSVVNFRVVKNIADMEERPRWKKGDFFGETFKGPMQE